MGQGIWKDSEGVSHWGNSDPRFKKGLEDPPASVSDYELVDFDKESTQFTQSPVADAFHVPKPTLTEVNDSSKVYFYYYFPRIGWLLLFLLSLIGVFVTISLIDSGLSDSWSSQGSRRLNDRHVPISLISTKTLNLDSPSFTRTVTNSTTCTPAIWNGRTFFSTYDGKLAALKSKTFEPIWEIDICVDLYKQTPLVCSASLDLQLYISVATPTIWGDNLVISIKQPADIVVISQSTGQLIRKITLDENQYAEVTQSGTVWSDALYVGTSISPDNQVRDISRGDGSCSFVGQFFKINLNNMDIIWSTPTVNPNEDDSEGNQYSSFYGIPVIGSSPPISTKEGLVYFTTGNVGCAPQEYWDCLSVYDYVDIEEQCHNDPRWKYALFNSIVALDMKTGHMVWYEKLIGYRTWDISCSETNYISPTKASCGNIESFASCPFKKNRYANCPGVGESYFQDFQFASDPVLQIHSDGSENLYALQQNGLVYSLQAKRSVANKEKDPNARFIWATHVFRASGMGGLAVDKANVYFTLGNYFGDDWYIDDSYTPHQCGGWGALNTHDGLPRWYTSHPLCGQDYDYFWAVNKAGSFAPPTVTNDVLLITSSDKPSFKCNYVGCNPSVSTNHSSYGGHLYSTSTKDGSTVDFYQTGSSFYQQGVSLHDRCIFAGDGYLKAKDYTVGSHLYAWCVSPYKATTCES